jgi:putative FmdB family regulatory protein
MPIYEYECRRCGHRLEAMQRLSDPPLKRCPQCRGALKKLVSAPAFQFKGSGWYVTDYAGKKSAGAEGEGKTEAKAEGKTEGKGEGKPEAKGEGGTEGKGKADAGGGEAAGGGSKRTARSASGAG